MLAIDMNLVRALQIIGIGSFEELTTYELKARYRKLAKEKHPDRQNGSHKEFVALREAYVFLSKELEKNQPVNSDLQTMTKDEILSKYFAETRELNLRVESLEDSVQNQIVVLHDLKQSVEEVIQEFEASKQSLQNQLDKEIQDLQSQFEPNLIQKILFFLPRMKTEHFWQMYNQKVAEYSKKNQKLDYEFNKKLLEIYGEGLNEITDIVSRFE
jgi:uncharacterized protein YukE